MIVYVRVVAFDTHNIAISSNGISFQIHGVCLGLILNIVTLQRVHTIFIVYLTNIDDAHA